MRGALGLLMLSGLVLATGAGSMAWDRYAQIPVLPPDSEETSILLESQLLDRLSACSPPAILADVPAMTLPGATGWDPESLFATVMETDLADALNALPATSANDDLAQTSQELDALIACFRPQRSALTF